MGSDNIFLEFAKEPAVEDRFLVAFVLLRFSARSLLEEFGMENLFVWVYRLT